MMHELMRYLVAGLGFFALGMYVATLYLGRTKNG